LTFSELFSAFKDNPAVALLVLCILGIAWLVKDARAREAAHSAEIREQYEARAKETHDANAAHLQTALQVAPLAAKLVSCVEILERLTTAYAAKRE
jgi:hypothetical protein